MAFPNRFDWSRPTPAELLRDRLADDWHAARGEGHDAVMLAHRPVDVATMAYRQRLTAAVVA